MRAKKPKDFPCPFVVVVDTREQQPFGFKGIRADAKDGGGLVLIETVSRGLKTGDYSIDGHETGIVVERKDLKDLYNCIGHDRERFERQVQRLNEFTYSAIVIEAGWPAIWAGIAHSRLKPKSVHRTVLAWQQRYPRVHWNLCPTREFAEATTFRILERYWKDLHSE